MQRKIINNYYNTNYLLNFGPQHPAAHGVLRLILELNGERVISLDPHIGFLHRGTEKLLETKNYIQALPYFDRLDYVSMFSQEHMYILALESLLNFKVSLPIQYIRVIIDELTRILNHIMCITTHALDIGALTPFLWGFEEREHIMKIYETVSGARMHANYCKIGGVTNLFEKELLEYVFKFVTNLENYIENLEMLLSNNPIWISRLKNIGVISTKEALNLSFSGPALRGSNIPWDLRKTQPYEIYSKIDFNVCVGNSFDCYSRYMVRLFEMKESISIINQCISLLFEKDLKSNFLLFETLNIDFKKIINKKNNYISYKKKYNYFNSKNSMEELIFHFLKFSKGLPISKGSVYSAIEAPKGESGVFIVSDGTPKPYRCRIRAPGFFHLQGLNFLSKNLFIADVVSNIGSLDIVFGEIDR